MNKKNELLSEDMVKKQQFDTKTVLSEFWVFQEKVDMKVSAFSFTTSLLIFGYL